MKLPNPPPLERKLSAAWPPGEWRDLTVLVAVSGGPDSVALLRALANLKGQAGGAGRLVVGHFDHRLRPDSAADRAFVGALAQELHLPFETGEATAEQLAQPMAEGIEAAVREMRYAFLQSTAEKVGARYVALGHTADDQVETVLFNLMRGTGLAGLGGMPRARALGTATSLIRPLLDVRRSDVLEYLHQCGQSYRVDSSNLSPDFARNRIRHELLPLVREKFGGDIDQAVVRLAQLAGDAQRLIEELADDLLERCLQRSQERHEVYLNIAPLASTNRHLVREMFVALWRRMNWPLKDMGYGEWNSLAEMAMPPSSSASHSAASQTASSRTFPGNILVRRQDDALILSPGGR